VTYFLRQFRGVRNLLELIVVRVIPNLALAFLFWIFLMFCQWMIIFVCWLCHWFSLVDISCVIAVNELIVTEKCSGASWRVNVYYKMPYLVLLTF